MEYVANGGNATQAYISAGYSESTAEQASSRLLTNVKVQERVKELQTSVAERLGITQEYLLGHLKEIIDNHTNPNKDRLRAVEMAGKNLAMWIERRDSDTRLSGEVATTSTVILVPQGQREAEGD
jgi:phage terminase small subunit